MRLHILPPRSAINKIPLRHLISAQSCVLRKTRHLVIGDCFVSARLNEEDAHGDLLL